MDVIQKVDKGVSNHIRDSMPPYVNIGNINDARSMAFHLRKQLYTDGFWRLRIAQVINILWRSLMTGFDISGMRFRLTLTESPIKIAKSND